MQRNNTSLYEKYKRLNYIQKVYIPGMITTGVVIMPVCLSYAAIESFNMPVSSITSSALTAFSLSALALFSIMLALRGLFNIHLTFKESVLRLNKCSIFFLSLFAFIPIISLLFFTVTFLTNTSIHLSLMMLASTCILLAVSSIVYIIVMYRKLSTLMRMMNSNDAPSDDDITTVLSHYNEDGNDRKLAAVNNVRIQYLIGYSFAILSLAFLSTGFFITQSQHKLAVALFISGGGLLAFTLLIPLAFKVSKKAYYLTLGWLHHKVIGAHRKHQNFRNQVASISRKLYWGLGLYLLSICALDLIFSLLAGNNVWEFKIPTSIGMAWFQISIALIAMLSTLTILWISNYRKFNEIDQADNENSSCVNLSSLWKNPKQS